MTLRRCYDCKRLKSKDYQDIFFIVNHFGEMKFKRDIICNNCKEELFEGLID